MTTKINPCHTESIERTFRRIGSKVRMKSDSNFIGINILPSTDRSSRRNSDPKEFFEIQTTPETRVTICDCDPADRHLLLHLETPYERAPIKFLCGHDERHWFAAAVPGRPASVQEAKRSLMPRDVRQAVERKRVGGSAALKRRNAAFVRQGEWFFVPMPDTFVCTTPILRDELLSRGISSKPHVCDELTHADPQPFFEVRLADHSVVQLTHSELKRLRQARQVRKVLRQFIRPTKILVCGKIRHPDHATIDLRDRWHHVLQNREHESTGTFYLRYRD